MLHDSPVLDTDFLTSPSLLLCHFILLFFFFNDTATTEIYTLSLHDALPICPSVPGAICVGANSNRFQRNRSLPARSLTDRKSTRLNSSHVEISYAVFCLKKKKKKKKYLQHTITTPLSKHSLICTITSTHTRI